MSTCRNYLVFALQITLFFYLNAAPNPKTACVTTFVNKKDGEFSSPNFPSSYNQNVSCVWIFDQLKEDQVLSITFDAFLLEPSENCTEAYIEISSTSQIANESIEKPNGRICGKRNEFTETIQGSRVLITFRSNSSKGYPGFHASFKILEQKSTEKHNGSSNADQDLNTPSNGTSKCQCGRSSRQAKRIVGGGSTDLNEYPWLVVLVIHGSETSAHCGAALIGTKHVLTAAHCTNHHEPSDYLAIFGAHSLMSRTDKSEVRKVVEIHRHSQYNSTNEHNDIAILELDTPVTFNDAVQTICLPTSNNLFTGETGVAAGWGKTEYTGKNSDIPLEVRMPVVTNKDCQEKFASTSAVITENNLCAGVLNGERDACQGDSGGPLMWKNADHQWYLIGIVSYGVKCATPGFYGVYTRVNKYTEWIEKTTGQNICRT